MAAPNDAEREVIVFGPSLLLNLLPVCDTPWPFQGQALRTSAKMDPGFVGSRIYIMLRTLLKKRNIKLQMPTKFGPWKGCVWKVQRDPGREDYPRKKGRRIFPVLDKGACLCCNKRFGSSQESSEVWKPLLISQASAPPVLQAGGRAAPAVSSWERSRLCLPPTQDLPGVPSCIKERKGRKSRRCPQMPVRSEV